MRILLAEDDEPFAEALIDALTKQGLAVDRTRTVAETEHAVQQAEYRLLLLDRQLPDGDGATLVPKVRASQVDLPILILTAMHLVTDKVEGLDAGADDYLAKPFDMAELMARIRALIRRPARMAPAMVLGDLAFDFESKQAFVRGAELKLPRRQILALEALCFRQGRTVRRASLEQSVYGLNDHVESNALESHISRLRKALVGSGVDIHTIRGIGYVLKQSAPED
ncbi:response regulator [Xanthomonas melonis]|uniref:DNA-binding response regulator n=1 Tax=Xanthomonas melonis TaxID=56456 RepID=A0A2S7D9K1_9XANT|nr:response regulator transcription factor [Xanthomonas melonis]MCC4602260.1 response regulator transcription factor [Xanthomonas melonis]PPU70508.1 DNA-binding response regulator [Xanthomonas melonis]